MAEAAGQAGILLLLRKASHASAGNDPMHFEREADGEKALGIGLQQEACRAHNTPHFSQLGYRTSS